MSDKFEQISLKPGFMMHNGGVLFRNISETEYEFKSKINENHQNKIDEASLFQKKLEGKVITIEIESNEEGNLYGNVNQKVIIDEIAKTYNVHLSADNLILSPIKNLGNHDFSVRLYDNLIANMQIQILNKSK